MAVKNLYIFAGQSNAQGTGALTSDLSGFGGTPTISAVDFYYYTAPSTRSGWVGLQPTTVTSQTRPGLEYFFGRRLATKVSDLAIIRHARGGTPFYPSGSATLTTGGAAGTPVAVSYNTDESGNEWSALKTTVSGGLAALAGAGHTYVLRGFIWIQGESDAKDGITGQAGGTYYPQPSTADGYAARLSSFLTKIQTAGWDGATAQVPEVIYIGKVHSSGNGGTAGDYGYGTNGTDGVMATVSAAKDAAIAANPTKLRLLDLTGEAMDGTDKIHVTTAGVMSGGMRLAMAEMARLGVGGGMGGMS